MATTPVSKTIDQIDVLQNPTRQSKVIVGTATGNKLYTILLSALLALVTKQDVGLENVDNTADSQKPVSSPQAQAIATRASQQDLTALAQAVAGKASQEQMDAVVQAIQNFITGDQLDAALEGYATADHGHTVEQIENLVDILNGKANNDKNWPQSQIQNLTDDLNSIRTSILGKAATNHSHTAASITGLPEMIADIINQLPNLGSVSSGVNQW